MVSGVETKDVIIGSGLIADHESQVAIHVRGVLNQGDVFLDTNQNQHPIRIELHKRDSLAGLRYGVVGMRVGGRRELVVSPHLGYGSEGLPGKVPPNAVLRFEVELLEVRLPGTSKPEDYPPGKHLYFLWPGEASRNWPRIQFGLTEDGCCGVTLTIPQPKCTWRHAISRAIEHRLDKQDTIALFEEVAMLPQIHPQACLNNDQLWADSLEKANSVTRDSLTSTPCISIGISERGVWQCYYALRETDPVLMQSNLYRLVKDLAAKFLPSNQKE